MNPGRYAVWLMLLILLVGLAARLVPLEGSDLPYNIDGFPQARISEIIISTGELPNPAGYSGLLAYNMKLPVFPMLLSVFSLTLGVEPLTLLPYFCALVGSLAAVFIFALTRELSGNVLAAFSAGMFAALSGLFVYVTTAAMKQLLAIVLLCLLLFFYSRRGDRRFRLGMVPVLLLLPFTHHLTTLIALLTLTFATVGTAFRRSSEHVRTLRELALDIVTGPGILLISLWYYQASDMEFVSDMANVNDIMLLASVVILMAVVARMLSVTVQTRPWFLLPREGHGKLSLGCVLDEKVLVLMVGIGALYLNSRVHLFTGGTMTSDALLRLMFPYLALAVLGLMGFNVLRYSRFPRRYMLVGMFLAPLSVMVFSLLHGMDAFGLMLVYRSYNFIDIPLAVSVGVGVAYVLARLRSWSGRHREFRHLPYTFLAVFLLLTLASLPLAYNGQELFHVRDVTLNHEFAALKWADGHNVTSICTDQRYSDIAEPYFGIRSDRTGPWRIARNRVDPNTTLFVCQDWTDTGAQMYPLEPVVIKSARFSSVLDSMDIYYSGGPEGRVIYIGENRAGAH